MKSIKFSKNWNRKLDCDVFTTIRKKGYWVEQGDVVAILLKDRIYKWAECIGRNEIPFINICGSVIAFDTGLIGKDALQLFERMGINTVSESEQCCLLVLKSCPKPPAITSPEATLQLGLFKG